MTEEEIIKALECCVAGKKCRNCPLETDDACFQTLRVEALDLINSKNAEMEKALATIDGLINGQETLQKYIAEKDAEIERLQGRNRRLESAFVAECDLSACPRKREIRDEAIKDVVNRAKKRIGDSHFQNYGLAIMEIMDVEKEMVGEADA